MTDAVFDTTSVSEHSHFVQLARCNARRVIANGGHRSGDGIEKRVPVATATTEVARAAGVPEPVGVMSFGSMLALLLRRGKKTHHVLLREQRSGNELKKQNAEWRDRRV
jgi:hypothetical protein